MPGKSQTQPIARGFDSGGEIVWRPSMEIIARSNLQEFIKKYSMASLDGRMYLNTTVWGDGTGGSSKLTDGYLLGLITVIKTYTVYGRIPARQNIPAGAYADTITVTVNY